MTWSLFGSTNRTSEGTPTKYNHLSNNSGRESLSLSTKRIIYCVTSFIQDIFGKELAIIHSIVNSYIFFLAEEIQHFRTKQILYIYSNKWTVATLCVCSTPHEDIMSKCVRSNRRPFQIQR